jgi:hypothetical protein
VRLTSTRTRWVVCFVALPALWIAATLLSADLGAAGMISAAGLVALLSALTAHRSGLRARARVGYFVGTVAMMGLAITIAIIVLFGVYCDDGYTSGAC